MSKLIVSLLASASLLALSTTAHAASWVFSGMLDSGYFLGESYSGTVTSTVAPTGSGLETFAIDQISLSFLGQTWSLSDAQGTPDISYLDGQFLGAFYTAGNVSVTFTLIPGFSNASEAFIAYDTPLGNSGAGNLIYAPVPEPETYALFLAGLGIVGAIARRRATA